ncbi:MAG: phosphate ABC transporter permease PstA [Lachnospiraceae bacterium]
MYNSAVSIYTDPISDNTCSIYGGRKRRFSDIALQTMIDFSAAISILLLLFIVCYVAVRGIGTISLEFLTTVPSTINGTFGIAGNIVNTLYLIVLTLLIATPIGIGAAIYLNEYAKPGRLVRLIEFTTETLSGIPSIIFGLFGMIFFGSALGLQYSLLTGALTMTLMILPLITRNTQEALKTVPDSYRSGALGIGATKWYMIRTILIPSALPGIVTGVILAIGRIVGESAALLFTAGSGFLLPKSGLGFFEKIFQPGGTLTIQLYLCMSKAQYDEAFGIAFILLLIVLVINFLTKYAVRKLDVGSVKTTDKTDGGAFGE